MGKITYPLYLDHHATTPVDPQVLEAMLPFFSEHFGNPESAQHPYGWKAKTALDEARENVARLLGAQAQEILFTSGATESIHLAILGFMSSELESRAQKHAQKRDQKSDPPPHLITSNAEHKCALEAAAKATRLGCEVTYLPVNSLGQITREQVLDALKPNTVMVSLIHGNNEIGSLNPIEAIGQALESRGIVFHVDAAQSVGKTPIDVHASGIGLLSLSAHKFHGPKGVGALYVRRSGGRVHLTPYLSGGGQERGLRGGTHNVPGIVGLGKAAALALELMPNEAARLQELRDHLITEVRRKLGAERVDLNGHPTERLCNNINLSIHGVSSDSFLLGLREIAFSSSSACSSGTASHVLQAIGQKTNDPLTSTIRLGLGRGTTDKDIEFAIDRIICAAQKS